MTKSKKFLIINGPNLNFLGTRERDIYGTMSMDQIIKFTNDGLKDISVKLEWFQSNIEGEIVEKIQKSLFSDIDALIINPAAYTHTSVAIFDALSMVKVPIIEVHLSNTNKREEFRQTKITTKASSFVLEGFGHKAYLLAIKSQLI